MTRRLVIGLLLAFGLPALAQAEDSTTLLNPGYVNLETGLKLDTLDLSGQSGGEPYAFEASRTEVPLQIRYGLVRKTELALMLPLVSCIASESTEPNNRHRDWCGLGDLEGGIKYLLLSDTGEFPAIFTEAGLQVPTGGSRFRDYVRTLGDPAAAMTATGLGTCDLVLKATLSQYVNPLELFLQLRVDLPWGDDFITDGIHNHIDYGDRFSLSAGAETAVADHLTLAARLVEISTAASVWTQDGQNALALAGSRASALMAQTRTQAGVNLGNTTELYFGPSMAWEWLPATYLKLSLLVGLTRDSQAIQAMAGLATAFSVSRLLDRRQNETSDQPDPLVVETPWHSVFFQDKTAAEIGNRRKWVQQQTEKALAARKLGHLEDALQAWNRILAQFPDEQAAQTAASQVQQELAIAEQEYLGKAALAAQDDDLLTAVTALRQVLVMDPGQESALAMLRDYDYDIREHSRTLYQEGLEFQTRGDYNDAIARWEDALMLTPGDPTVKDSLRQLQEGLEAWKQMGKKKP